MPTPPLGRVGSFEERENYAPTTTRPPMRVVVVVVLTRLNITNQVSLVLRCQVNTRGRRPALPDCLRLCMVAAAV